MSWWKSFEEAPALLPPPLQRTIVELFEEILPEGVPGVVRSLHFEDFHAVLLKTFVIILAVTLLLIFLSWKLYGKRISERFMKPATSKALQELKESVSRLKLPKEHTPRI